MWERRKIAIDTNLSMSSNANWIERTTHISHGGRWARVIAFHFIAALELEKIYL